MLLEFTDTNYEEKRYTCGEGNECQWVPMVRHTCPPVVFYPGGCTTLRSCGTPAPVGWDLCQERLIELSLTGQAHLNMPVAETQGLAFGDWELEKSGLSRFSGQ